jgi:hypothetical protein
MPFSIFSLFCLDAVNGDVHDITTERIEIKVKKETKQSKNSAA